MCNLYRIETLPFAAAQHRHNSGTTAGEAGLFALLGNSLCATCTCVEIPLLTRGKHVPSTCQNDVFCAAGVRTMCNLYVSKPRLSIRSKYGWDTVQNDVFCAAGFSEAFAWRGFAMCTWNCIETPHFLLPKYSTDTAKIGSVFSTACAERTHGATREEVKHDARLAGQMTGVGA
jgi:hypothetical protein